MMYQYYISLLFSNSYIKNEKLVAYKQLSIKFLNMSLVCLLYKKMLAQHVLSQF